MHQQNGLINVRVQHKSTAKSSVRSTFMQILSTCSQPARAIKLDIGKYLFELLNEVDNYNR